MSNPFYNYINEVLLSFFRNQKVKPGDRYYLQLERDEDVEALISSLKQVDSSKDFSFKHEFGERYDTFCIPINDINLVIAHTSPAVVPDFLVTLRNQVGEQKAEWFNTALFSIVSTQLDSIQGGSSDLQKEGMPLHPNLIVKTLKYEIENSNLSKVDKIILQDKMDVTLQEQVYQQITFFEFEDIFTALAKGYIDDEDYKNFGLFKDSDLDTFTGVKLKKRLENNRELFDFVRKNHEYGLDDELLERKFSPAGLNKIKSENWQELSYSEIYYFNIEAENSKRNTKIDLKDITSKSNLVFWDRPQKETTAGLRKRHIIIFNTENHEEVSLQAAFTIEGGNVKSLSDNHLRIAPKFEKHTQVSVGRINIQITIECSPSNTTFTKVTYRHEGKSALGAEFLIAVIPIDSSLLEAYKTSYIVDPSQGLLQLQYDGNVIVFGDPAFGTNTVEISQENQMIQYHNKQQLILNPLPEAFNDEDQLPMKLLVGDNNAIISFLLVNELPESIPITAYRIWKLKREHQQNFIMNSNRLIFGNREFYLNNEYKQYFDWEQEWLSTGLKCAELESGSLEAVEINVGDELREAYSRFLNYFSSESNIPSLCYYSSELCKRASDYLIEYTKEIASFQENQEAGKRGTDLFKLGTISTNDGLYFTPFHPIVIAYQLQLQKELQKEEVENNILTRLRPDALVPYVYKEKEYNERDQLYKAEPQTTVMEWMMYKPVNHVTVADANKYLAKVVEDKLSQFHQHFSYLFSDTSRAPLKINLLNIENDSEVLRGIISWMIEQINSKGFEGIAAIEVVLYRESDSESSFDRFSQTESIDELQTLFNVKLSSRDYDALDILRLIRSNLFYFKRKVTDSIEYAHISFFKMNSHEQYAIQPMADMPSGLSLDGLYSYVPSMKNKGYYRSGFGIKSINIEENNLLVLTAIYVNELCANLRNNGNDSYRKRESIFSRTSAADEQFLARIYQASHWVTFVDSNIDLDFFNDYTNLVVIHYSDQYSSSNKYDAITVTDKTHQYHSVIKEFLSDKEVDSSESSVIHAIKAFNTFNGEWLLRIIGSKGHYSREKLSIISAIKYALAYFDHNNITWVPISLEEILRVAGAVSLNKSDGVFTAKNLGVTGSHSDDLLLIGLENRDDKLSLHFYPVEVKIGINNSDVLDKAKKQVKQTKRVINDALSKSDEKTFTSKFYRYFFVQLLITNAIKLDKSEFWADKNFQIPEEALTKLLADDFSLSFDIEQFIGEGAILSFQRDVHHRSSNLIDGITHIFLPEEDGYTGLIKTMENMQYWIQHKDSDFIKSKLLSNSYGAFSSHHEAQAAADREQGNNSLHRQPPILENFIKENALPNSDNTTSISSELQHDDQSTPPNEEDELESAPPLEKMTGTDAHTVTETTESDNWRILIGRAENSDRNIYWEYGNEGLANRHLLISGKSGQGKTYFMQCMLLEMSKLGLSSIVIDYTEGFLPNQLEPEFKNFLGQKLTQKIIINEQFPINPFKKNIRDIGGITLPENNTDVAERIKSVFSAVYRSLGIQQLNAIYEAVLVGLSRYDDEMSLPRLKAVLEEDNSSYSKTALSQIRPLIDRNPFKSNSTMNWNDIIEGDGQVYIVQLTGYPRDVQLIITEFILWELWNYSVRYGNKNKPLPVIMDEAQNLDHTEKSPSAKILTEGRKFGWSGWYATQFLKSQLGADELARLQNATQKIYFAQPEQELAYIANSLSTDPSDRKRYETKISSLKKGQCIIHGPIAKENGTLTNPMVTAVDIIPLSERIKQ